jgi:RNA-directed DNA polymerase
MAEGRSHRERVRTASHVGTPQGAVISPLLANVYLHYVFDLWTHRWRRQEAKGDVIVVRYADDSVVGFELAEDAQAFLDSLRLRLGQFGLALNEAKTRILEFGRYAIERRARRGQRRPATADRGQTDGGDMKAIRASLIASYASRSGT